MRRGRLQPRGFTLIELLVGAAVMSVILAGAAMVLLAASQQHRRGLEKANLERACNQLIGQMEAELRQAGLGLPKGTLVGGSVRFPAAILQANPNDIVFFADLARPNSSFNGISQLSDDQTSTLPDGVAVLNELNGTCDVYSAGAHCQTNTSSALFSGATDCGVDSASITCPWALDKYQASEWVMVANGKGDWAELQLSPTVFVSRPPRKFLQLAGARPGGLFPVGIPNRGFVSTPDRVFYELNAGTVRRQQCWSQLGTPIDPASIVVKPCDAPANGTDWEVRARDVAALSFEYRDAADAIIAAPVPVADLRRIRRVVITLSLQRALSAATTATVRADATASATVRL
ncbi:MAG TPA: prepilin-type N-terminal cleavage/methylation domain-containing protein [Myxococcaceae bacterium]|nr:prepilin-type N-terminal cleavage/methylation domain-containing protein [Myxococcaceae bacterium]